MGQKVLPRQLEQMLTTQPALGDLARGWWSNWSSRLDFDLGARPPDRSCCCGSAGDIWRSVLLLQNLLLGLILTLT